VIKRLGDPEHINPKVIESLFAGDLLFCKIFIAGLMKMAIPEGE
jgi:hypothetical protein